MSVCSVGPRVGGTATPKRCVPKSGSREPEDQPAEWQTPKRKAAEPTRRGQPRSGACRKAEAVSPKANPPSRRTNSPRVTPKRCMPKSGSREPEGQPTERQPRSGACRKSEVVNPKANSPSGNPEAEGRPERRKPPEPRAVKPAGRSRETRGRRSSADTPTNTIEKRDCDTLRPSETS